MMLTDQAERLRRLVDDAQQARSAISVGPATRDSDAASAQAPAQARTSIVEPKQILSSGILPNQRVRLSHGVAICSGKGGVGKTNLAVNLAVTFALAGRSTVLIDADLGTSNADVLCNLNARYTMDHVLRGTCSMMDILLDGPGGFRLIPGASGIDRLADLAAIEQRRMLEELVAIERSIEALIIDAAAGISSNVTAFASAAHTVIVITTPEPTALTDAYAMIKSLVRRVPGIDIRVVVNEATEAEGADAFVRLNRVSQRFLDQPLRYGGSIPWDAAVPDAVRARMPVRLFAPDCPASRAIERIGWKLTGSPASASERASAAHLKCKAADNDRSPGFFARLGQWLRGTAFADA